ncbi:MAG: ABC transporter permease [Candidatus Heimdallarchaeota archaeon]
MVNVYLKGVRKQWLIGIAVPLSVAIFIPLIASIWPDMKAQAAAWAEFLKNPIYKAFLGDVADLSTWAGFYNMYIFVWLEWIIMFVAIFIPARIISNEVNKNTLDVMLSYPIPRWRFVLEKFSVYLSYNFLYPIILVFVTYYYTNALNEQMNYTTLTYSLIGVWLLLFAFGAISLLCGSIFLDRAVSASGAFILSQFLFKSIGQLQESLEILKKLSLFSYLNASTIVDLGRLPWDELFIVVVVGLLALLAALYIFQKRELAF